MKTFYKLIYNRIFFPVIEAVKNATEIKFIDTWRCCLSTSIYPFSYRDLPPAGTSDHFVIKVDWFWLADVTVTGFLSLLFIPVRL